MIKEQRFNTNRPVQSQLEARSLKFHIGRRGFILSSDVDNYFSQCVQNKCTVRTDNITVYAFSVGSYSNLSFRIKLIDMHTYG